MSKASKGNQTGDCAVCGGQTRLIIVPTWDVPASASKPAVTVRDIEALECGDCGERYLEPNQIRAFEKKVLDAQRVALGLLTADEIKQIREKLGIQKERLEKILNFNPKSFYRWEEGYSIQSDAVDTTLRILRKHPEAIFELAEERGVPLNVKRGRPSSANKQAVAG